MRFDWSQYLNVARELAGQATHPSSDVAKLRAAISRAYYAAFNEARVHLYEKDYDRSISRSGAAHGEVQRKFKNDPDHTRRKIGVNLERLFIQRKKADYRDEFGDLKGKTEFAIKQAEGILEWLDTLP